MIGVTTRYSVAISMSTKEDLLKKYDGPNQDTKREIIKYLYDNPDMEHKPDVVFQSIQDKCRAGKETTVANQISELSKSEDLIKQEKRSYYQWKGQGDPHPNRRLKGVKSSVADWINSLGISYGTLLLGFVVWLLGIFNGFLSLIALFTSGSIGGVPFITWFQFAGLFTILGSSVVMIWIPLYLVEVWLKK
ncbi:hypothetical protein ACFQMF_12770 [Halorubrum rutilum]|uniref:Uncharacterized protein n=1 Tax=Halorubrum rutilum TaxID=1364933 RepID=A0ABD6AN32_9EURY|nr:hypothetical protein [Halorubrum rutilum]